MSKSEKLTQFVIVICIAAIITAVGNVMDGKHLFSDSLVGVAILAVLATIGALILTCHMLINYLWYSGCL